MVKNWQAELFDPITIEGEMTAWLFVYRANAGLCVGFGDTGKSGSAFTVNGLRINLSANELGTFSNVNDVPTGLVLARVRRDENNDIYFAFIGQAESQGSGPEPTACTLTFNKVGEYISDELAGNSPGCYVIETRIEPGPFNATNAAAYETSLIGAAL